MPPPTSSGSSVYGDVQPTPIGAQATPGAAQDPSWTLGQWSGHSTCSESGDFKTTVDIFNDTLDKLSQGKFQPLKSPLRKQWDDATAIEQRDCLKTAEMSCRILCGVIAPNAGDKLYEALTMEKNVQATNDLRTLATAYKNAPSKNLKTQILSLYALNYTNKQLKKIHKPFEELSDRQIKKSEPTSKENRSWVTS